MVYRAKSQTMQIECNFFGPFREAIGTKTISRETDATTIGEFLSELEKSQPDLEGKILAENGDDIAGNTVVIVDDTNIKQLEGLETELCDGASVQFAQSIHGG